MQTPLIYASPMVGELLIEYSDGRIVRVETPVSVDVLVRLVIEEG
jgi:hypothetical protein